jgi:hypothetical protein
MRKKRAALIASLIVIPIWLAWYRSLSQEDYLLPVILVFPLLPGHITSMMIGGAHGSSPGMETLGLVAGIGVNILVYTFLVLGVAKLYRRLFKRPASQGLRSGGDANNDAHSPGH